MFLPIAHTHAHMHTHDFYNCKTMKKFSKIAHARRSFRPRRTIKSASTPLRTSYIHSKQLSSVMPINKCMGLQAQARALKNIVASARKYYYGRSEILLQALTARNKNTNMEDMPQCPIQKLLDNFISAEKVKQCLIQICPYVGEKVFVGEFLGVCGLKSR